MTRRWVKPSRFTAAVAGWSLLLPALVLSRDQAQTTATATSSDPVFIRFVSRSASTPRMADEPVTPVPDNPVTDGKAALGRRLFFDKRLSIDRSVSCATCHNPERGFADDRSLAVGVFGRVGKRHSPALVNRAYGRAHFWDGRAATLEAQVLLPVVDPNEMALTLDELMTRLGADETYAREFHAVFERPMSQDDVRRALATYLRTITSVATPYDQFRDGIADALTADAQAGLSIFRGKGACIICHREPTFTDENFHNTGVAWDPATATFTDDGRFTVTGREPERGRFKTPTLREIGKTAPYMHDGSLKTLADVIDFYDRGGRPNRNLFPAIRPLGLTAQEKASLVAFLESLSGPVTGK